MKKKKMKYNFAKDMRKREIKWRLVSKKGFCVKEDREKR